jgi:hypothetical protein
MHTRKNLEPAQPPPRDLEARQERDRRIPQSGKCCNTLQTNVLDAFRVRGSHTLDKTETPERNVRGDEKAFRMPERARLRAERPSGAPGPDRADHGACAGGQGPHRRRSANAARAARPDPAADAKHGPGRHSATYHVGPRLCRARRSAPVHETTSPQDRRS